MMLVHTLLRQRLAERRWEASPEETSAVLSEFEDRPEVPCSFSSTPSFSFFSSFLRLFTEFWPFSSSHLALLSPLRLLSDLPAQQCPYSIHKIALAGAKCGKSIGQWFAPSTFGLALEHVVAGLETRY